MTEIGYEMPNFAGLIRDFWEKPAVLTAEEWDHCKMCDSESCRAHSSAMFDFGECKIFTKVTGHSA